jgi:hypothetical protein
VHRSGSAASSCASSSGHPHPVAYVQHVREVVAAVFQRSLDGVSEAASPSGDVLPVSICSITTLSGYTSDLTIVA